MAPRKQWIDKKSATTFQLLHRSQNDPLIHEESAEDRILHKVSGPAAPEGSVTSSSSKSGRKLADLEQEFRSKVRQNEGEAANHGVFYDDSNYDYMQHLKELGGGGGQTQFIEAKAKGKGKAEKLEDALGKVSLGEEGDSENLEISEFGSAYGDDYLSTASSYMRQPSYQDQQDIPDAIAGFKPDMDPRLREALEALEDDAFVGDDDEEDLFNSLVEGGRGAEIDPGEWEDMYEEEEDGWESDATEKAPNQGETTTFESDDVDGGVSLTSTAQSSQQDTEVPDMAPADGDWLREFAKYKKDMKSKPAPPTQGGNVSDFRTTPSTMFTAGGTPIRTKKRKGARTNPSAYSMTSSSLARTEGHRLLDDRFEKIETLYSLDEEVEDFDDASGVESMSIASGMSGLSQAPSLVSRVEDPPLRSDFDQVMDGFLEGWTDRGANAKRKGAKGKRGKNGNEVAGIKMLDEVRQGLGPARFTGKA